MENGMQMTLEECMPGTFQKQIAGASDSLARISQLPENSLDLKETVQACFLELCTLSDNSKKKIDPLIFSLRTLRICLVLMEDGISPGCSLKWSKGGYDAEWQVLNSKDFEVPQNRERVFIIGHLRGRSASEVFPVEGANGENSVHLILDGCINGRNSQRDRIYSKSGLCPTIATKPGGNTEPKVTIPCFIDLSYKKIKLTDTARCLQARYAKGPLTHEAETSGVAIKIIGEVNHSQDGQVHSIDGIAKCHSAGHNNSPKVAIPVLAPDRAEKRQNGRRFKEDGDSMFTLTGQDRHGVAVEVVRSECAVNENGIYVQFPNGVVCYAVWCEKHQCYIAIRKLTPKECFRLQGWTDDYFEKAAFVNSDSQLYKQAGNGVTVNVIYEISKMLRESDND